MVTTMRDVAIRAGVSVKTVSNTLNGYAPVLPDTRAKVERAVVELGYRMNMSARQLRKGQTGVIALALPELALSFWGEFADLVVREASSHDLAVQIELTRGNRDGVLHVLGSPFRRMVDGMLLVPNGLDADETHLLSVDYPLVVLGESVFGAPADHVTIANEEGAHAAIAHLASRGCRRIAALGARFDEKMGSATLRFRGYRAALEEAGIAYDPRLVVESDPWTRTTGAEAMAQLLDSGVDVDGVFTMNDAMAFGALHTLHLRSVAVPRDVAVIGFDDVDDAAYYEPPLSSVSPGRSEIASTAIELLARRIDGDVSDPQLIHAAYHVEARASTSRS